MKRRPAMTGMTVFMTIWVGQLLSLIGSGLTSFALGVWVYLQTGSVTQFAFIFLAGTLPATLISPVAGAVVDRCNRRLLMMLCDSGSALTTLAILLLLSVNRLEIWHIYLAVAVNSTLNAFHWPAYSTLIPLLVPKQHIGRTNGMMQVAEAMAQLVSPVIAGILVVTIEIQRVLLIDLTTFLIALTTLWMVRAVSLSSLSTTAAEKTSLLQEAAYGWSYIAARRGLLGLMLFFAFSNFLAGVVEVLAQPLVLSFATTAELGVVLSLGGSGMLLGSLVMSLWGGPKRRIYSVLGFHMVAALAFILMGLRPSLWLVTAAAFVVLFSMPIINGSNRALMHMKVAPNVQGRVFAMSRMITSWTMPFGYVIAGPLADRVFEPLLAAHGPLAGSVGTVVGVGPGRGIGLLFMVLGALAVLVTAAGYLYKPLRRVEDELPDVLEDPGWENKEHSTEQSMA